MIAVGAGLLLDRMQRLQVEATKREEKGLERQKV